MISQQMRLIALMLFLVPFMIAQAQWSSDPSANNPICRAGNYQKAPQLVSDGKGGAIICWSDERDAQYFFRVYVQRIDKDGFVRWTENGVPLGPASDSQSKPDIVSDGAGGAIIVWGEARFGSMDIYAQRIDSSGKALWKADGVPVASGSMDQEDPRLVSDGQHGAFVTWSAHTGSNQDGHIYAQRIDGTGKLLWSPEISLSFSDQFESTPCITSDGSGGAYIAWVFYNNQDYDVYAQRVTSGGAQLWLSGGVALTASGGAQDTPSLVADGTGKAFLTHYDWTSGSKPTVHVLVLNPDGSAAASMRVTSTSGGQANPRMSNIGPGLLGIAWEDGRTAGKTRSYAQIIDNTGKKSWAANGVEVSNRAGSQGTPFIISDGNSGVIVCWEDLTSGLTESDIYAQRLSASGSPLWTSAGAPVGKAGRMQQLPWMISDGASGAIAAWEDYRPSLVNPEIYASRILADGTFPLGPPVLTLTPRKADFGAVSVGTSSTRSISLGNTGGVPVTIASVTSSDPHFTLTADNNTIDPKGSVWAMVEFKPTSKNALNAYIVIQSNSIFGPDTVFVSGSGTASAAIEIDRSSMDFGNVKTGSSKSLVLNISNPGNDTLTISSIAADNPVFTVDIASRILAPGEAFAETVRFSPTAQGPVSGELTLTSNAPSSPTILPLSGSGILLEVTITIDPAEISFGDVLLGSHKDTTLTITNTGNDTLRISSFTSGNPRFTLETPIAAIAPAGVKTFTLRFAPDVAGPLGTVFTVASNAVTSPDTITVDGTGWQVSAVPSVQVFPGAFTLYPNYPNPFHPSTTIRYDLEKSAPVRVAVYNSLGQIVATLADETQRPGTHTLRWTPADRTPGVYFLLLRVGEHEAYGRMVLTQ